MRSDRDMVEALEEVLAEDARPLPEHVRDAAMAALPRTRRLSGRSFEVPRAWMRTLAVAGAAAAVVVAVSLGPTLVDRLQRLITIGGPAPPPASCSSPIFAAPVLLDLSAIGIHPQAVATGDLNGDGHQDIVASLAWSLGDELAVVPGRGDGTFGDPVGYESVPMYSLATLDVDGDGDLDVAAAGDDGVWVFLGDGLGGLEPGSRLAAGAIPRDIVVGHFNDDEVLDLAAGNLASDEITIHHADEGGDFAATVSIPTDGAADSLTTADFNGDGRQDLAFISGQQPDVQVLLRGADGFGVVRRIEAVDPGLLVEGSPPSFIVAADLDLDLAVDLVVGNPAWGGFAVLLGDGLGGFSRAGFVSVSGEGPAAATVANLDQDRSPEIAIVTHQSRRVILFGRSEDGTYTAASEIVVEPAPAADVSGPEEAPGIAVADFNRDGARDLVVSNVASASATVLINLCRDGG